MRLVRELVGWLLMLMSGAGLYEFGLWNWGGLVAFLVGFMGAYQWRRAIEDRVYFLAKEIQREENDG